MKKWWKMRWEANSLVCFWLSYVVFLSSAWRNDKQWERGKKGGVAEGRACGEGKRVSNEKLPTRLTFSVWRVSQRPNQRERGGGLRRAAEEHQLAGLPRAAHAVPARAPRRGLEGNQRQERGHLRQLLRSPRGHLRQASQRPIMKAHGDCRQRLTFAVDKGVGRGGNPSRSSWKGRLLSRLLSNGPQSQRPYHERETDGGGGGGVYVEKQLERWNYGLDRGLVGSLKWRRNWRLQQRMTSCGTRTSNWNYVLTLRQCEKGTKTVWKKGGLYR